MKTPNEVINSDNSDKIDLFDDKVIDVCDIMIKNFEQTVNNINNKDPDKSFVSFVGNLPQYIEYDYDDNNFIQSIIHKFRTDIGEWGKYCVIDFMASDDFEYAREYWYCEISCKYDIKNKCYIEVERNK